MTTDPLRKLTSQLMKMRVSASQALLASSHKLINRPQMLLVVGLLSFFLATFSGWSFIMRVLDMQQWKEKIVSVESKLPLLETLSKHESDLLFSIRHSDPHYLEHQVSSMRLARLETYSLESSKLELSDNQAKRLHFLMSLENSFRFLVGKTVKGSVIQAQEMKQDHPVEVDETDIQRILAHIEGVTVGSYTPADFRPPMTIKKFSLKRKKEANQGFPSYLLDIELWHREAVQNL